MLGVVRSHSYYQHTAGNLINSLLKKTHENYSVVVDYRQVLCFPQYLIVWGFVSPIYICMLESIQCLMYRL